MKTSDVSAETSANKVDGFSGRFNELLTRSGFPEKKRTAEGARRFDVAHNTFKSWCFQDKLPGRHSQLLNMVDLVLNDIQGNYDAKAVVAWLISGDSVPHPFDERENILETIEVFFNVADRARLKGIDFDLLPRDAKELILKKTHAFVVTQPHAIKKDADTVTFEPVTIALVDSLLDMAQSLSS